MKYSMTVKGSAIYLDSDTGVISGNTYGARNEIKDDFKAVWDGAAKVWTADVEYMAKQLTTIRAYLERCYGLKEMIEQPKTDKPTGKPTDSKLCPICGSYCYGDCQANGAHRH